MVRQPRLQIDQTADGTWHAEWVIPCSVCDHILWEMTSKATGEQGFLNITLAAWEWRERLD